LLAFLHKVHTTERKSQQDDDEGPEQDETAANEENLFEHVKKVDQLHDALAKDAATEEQAKEQLSVLQEKDESDELKDKQDEEDDDVAMKDDDIIEDQSPIDQQEAEKISDSKKKGRRRGEPQGMEEDMEENPVESKIEFCFYFSSVELPHHLSLLSSRR
jgi:hypothetical protein